MIAYLMNYIWYIVLTTVLEDKVRRLVLFSYPLVETYLVQISLLSTRVMSIILIEVLNFD